MDIKRFLAAEGAEETEGKQLVWVPRLACKPCTFHCKLVALAATGMERVSVVFVIVVSFPIPASRLGQQAVAPVMFALNAKASKGRHAMG